MADHCQWQESMWLFKIHVRLTWILRCLVVDPIMVVWPTFFGHGQLVNLMTV